MTACGVDYLARRRPRDCWRQSLSDGIAIRRPHMRRKRVSMAVESCFAAALAVCFLEISAIGGFRVIIPYIDFLERAVSACVAETAERATQLAISYAPEGDEPRREPRLKSSIYCRAQGLSASVIADNPHAAYVEFGTGRRGAATGAGEGYDGDWAGMAAQSYMQRAADEMKSAFAREIITAVRDKSMHMTSMVAARDRGHEIISAVREHAQDKYGGGARRT